MTNIPDDTNQPIYFALEEMPDDKLSKISELVRAQRVAEAKVVEAENNLQAATKALNEIACNQLPAAMQELGFKDIVLTDGTKLEIRHEYHPGSLAQMPDSEREAMFGWLREHNADSIIKRLLSVRFGKGEDALAEELKKVLRKMLPEEMPIEDKADIHYQTLKAFVKERLTREADLAAEGISVPEPFPQELFKVFILNRAVLKEPKK